MRDHRCEGVLEERGYGSAIEYCTESEGKLWVGNGEYESAVKFCPYCGFTLEVGSINIPNGKASNK